MKLAAIFLSYGLLSAQVPGTAAAEKGSIGGVVRHSGTGEPLRKAQLTLRKMGANSQMLQVFTATDGLFTFASLEPGDYWMSVERPGFVRQDGAVGNRPGRNTAFRLGPGQMIGGVEVKLVPQGVVLGRVSDDEGDPVTRVQVSIVRTGVLRSNGPLSSVMTNDIGEFRIPNLTAGKYHVWAQPNPGWAAASAAEAFVVTYFPGVTDPSQAAAITVSPGQDTSGVTLRMRKSAVFTVRGKVVDLVTPGSAMNDTYLSLTQAARPGAGVLRQNTGMGSRAVSPDGRFELGGVAPGEYVLTAERRVNNRHMTARARLRVASGDAEGILLEFGNEPKISGAIRWEDAEDKSPPRGALALVPVDGASGSIPGVAAPNGRFRIEEAPHERFRFGFSGLPAGSYVKRVLLSGRDILDSGLDLTNISGEVALEVILSPKGGSVSCAVKLDGKPQPGYTVTLVPEPATAAAMHRLKASSSDGAGRCQFSGVAPGEYKLYALDGRDESIFLDAGAAAFLSDKGKRIVVAEGGREDAEVAPVEEGN